MQSSCDQTCAVFCAIIMCVPSVPVNITIKINYVKAISSDDSEAIALRMKESTFGEEVKQLSKRSNKKNFVTAV